MVVVGWWVDGWVDGWAGWLVGCWLCGCWLCGCSLFVVRCSWFVVVRGGSWWLVGCGLWVVGCGLWVGCYGCVAVAVVVVFDASLQTECFCQQTLRINWQNNQGTQPLTGESEKCTLSAKNAPHHHTGSSSWTRRNNVCTPRANSACKGSNRSID